MAEKQYIEREVAVEILKEKSLKMFNAYYKGYVNAIRDLIDIPSADVQEKKDCEKCIYFGRHATEYPCSHCRNCYTDKFQPMPSCGARMDGEEE